MSPALSEKLFSRHSSRRTLVGRRTRLKLAQCTKDIKVIPKEDVEVPFGTFEELSSHVTHDGKKLVLCLTERKRAEYPADIEILKKRAISAVPKNL